MAGVLIFIGGMALLFFIFRPKRSRQRSDGGGDGSLTGFEGSLGNSGSHSCSDGGGCGGDGGGGGD